MAGAVLETGARAAGGAVASSLGQLLFQMVLSRVTTPVGTPSDPVVEITREIQTVFSLYRQALTNSGISETDNPILVLPTQAGDPSVPTSGWIVRRYNLTGLRRPVIISAEFAPIVDRIIGKLKTFNAERNLSFLPGDTSWDAISPIRNYPLIIFLLLAATVMAVGDAVRVMDFNIAIKVVAAAKEFCTLINGAVATLRPAAPVREGEVLLSHLLSNEEPNGILKDLDSLQKLLIDKKKRHLFEQAVRKSNNALSESMNKIDRYFMAWLQGNKDPVGLPSFSEVSLASSLFSDYQHYTGAAGLRSAATTPGATNLIATIKKICGDEESVIAENKYWMLRVWCLPLTLDTVTDVGENFDATLINLMARKIPIVPIPPLSAGERLKEIFIQKMQSIILTLNYRIDPAGFPLPTLTPGYGSIYREAFTTGQAREIAESLWEICLLHHRVRLILEIGRELDYIAIILGSFTGHYIPNIAKYYVTLLEKMCAGLTALENAIQRNSEKGNYNQLHFLRGSVSAIPAALTKLINILNEEAIPELLRATSWEYIKEMQAELAMRLRQITGKLSILFPDKRAEFDRELEEVIRHVAGEISLPRAPAILSPDPSMRSRLTYEASLRSVLFESNKGHLAIINEAYRPTTHLPWLKKSIPALHAKAALENFIKRCRHIEEPEAGSKLTAHSFAYLTLEDLQRLSSLLIKIYAISRQDEKHALHDALSSRLASDVFTTALVVAPILPVPAAPAVITPVREPATAGAGAMPVAEPTPTMATVLGGEAAPGRTAQTLTVGQQMQATVDRITRYDSLP